MIPTFQSEAAFGHIYAAYGGIFVVFSILWGMVFERWRLDRFDLMGATIALVGVGVIM